MALPADAILLEPQVSILKFALNQFPFGQKQIVRFPDETGHVKQTCLGDFKSAISIFDKTGSANAARGQIFRIWCLCTSYADLRSVTGESAQQKHIALLIATSGDNKNR